MIHEGYPPHCEPSTEFPAKKEHAEPLVGRTQLPRPKLQLVVAAAWTQDILGLLKTNSKSDPCF
jgi:hypothetical protein